MLHNEPIVLLEEHFFAVFLVYKKSYEFDLKICRMKFSNYAHKYSTLHKIKFIHHAASHGVIN
jgi:hypothetical protein